MSTGNIIGDASQFPTPSANPQMHYDLRPLSTGEVLDRTFQIYRSRFALFAGLAMLPAGISVVSNALRLLYNTHQNAHLAGHVGAAFDRAQIISVTLSLVSSVILLVLYGITQAATTWALSAVYLGEAASIGAAYRVAFRNWFRYLLIVLRQVWAFMWLPLVLLVAAVAVPGIFGRGKLSWLTMLLLFLALFSMIYGIWAYLRISLAIPAAVIESLKVRGAVRRSAQLLVSRKIRIFLLLLLLIALSLVVATIQSPLLILAVRSRGTEAFVSQGINLVVSFVAQTLVGPVGAIAICVFYFDERVRREGFDIEWMMRKLGGAASERPESPVPPQESPTEPA